MKQISFRISLNHRSLIWSLFKNMAWGQSLKYC